MRHIATFCGQCNCGCPELYLDDAAAPERRVVITDDFGMTAFNHIDVGVQHDVNDTSVPIRVNNSGEGIKDMDEVSMKWDFTSEGGGQKWCH